MTELALKPFDFLRHGQTDWNLEYRAIGAKLSHLNTLDFQAKDFDLKHGYEIFGVLENCLTGQKRYYIKKVL